MKGHERFVGGVLIAILLGVVFYAVFIHQNKSTGVPANNSSNFSEGPNGQGFNCGPNGDNC